MCRMNGLWRRMAGVLVLCTLLLSSEYSLLIIVFSFATFIHSNIPSLLRKLSIHTEPYVMCGIELSCCCFCLQESLTLQWEKFIHQYVYTNSGFLRTLWGVCFDVFYHEVALRCKEAWLAVEWLQTQRVCPRVESCS